MRPLLTVGDILGLAVFRHVVDRVAYA